MIRSWLVVVFSFADLLIVLQRELSVSKGKYFTCGNLAA